jgi:hypothetical protein
MSRSIQHSSLWGSSVLGLAVLVLALAAPIASAHESLVNVVYQARIDGIDHDLQSRAETEAHVISQRIGVKLVKLDLAVGWARFDKYVANAKTVVLDETNGDPDLDNGHTCQIAVNRNWFGPIPHYEQDEVLAHEVFHCFEWEITRRLTHDWVTEGLARWVDLTLFPHTHLAGALESLTQYYDTPQQSLFRRSYDAVGFWAHAEDKTHDLWAKIPEIIRTDAYGSDAAAAHVAVTGGGSNEEAFLTDWGSSSFDLSSGPTPTWRTFSPLEGRYYPSTHAPDRVDTSTSYDLAPFAILRAGIAANPEEPIVEITWGPDIHGTFGVGQDLTNEEVTSKTFCTADEMAECECPPEDSGSLPDLTPLPSSPMLGAASNEIGGNVSVTFSSPGSNGECKPKPEPLLANSTCAGLFPGFSGGQTSSNSNPDGTFEAGCAVLTKVEGEGVEIIKGELNEFTLYIAGNGFLERFKTDAEATAEFHSSEPSGAISAAAGQEAFITRTTEVNPRHQDYLECSGEALVRVDNEIVGLAPYVAETQAACEGTRMQALLGEVAAQL